MNSEKVKELKKAVEYAIQVGLDKFSLGASLSDCLTLINELESERSEVAIKNHKLALQTIELLDENKQLKDRLAELEEALLDMVVQFCQMSKVGYLHHAFMSAEENAFDVLDIKYGEKVDDVYKRFNEKWGKKGVFRWKSIRD